MYLRNFAKSILTVKKYSSFNDSAWLNLAAFKYINLKASRGLEK
jgi:hypothetical protein